MGEAGILRNLRCAFAACAATPFNGAQWFSQAVPGAARSRRPLDTAPAGFGGAAVFPPRARTNNRGRAFCAAWMLPAAAHGRAAYSRRHTGPWPGQNR